MITSTAFSIIKYILTLQTSHPGLSFAPSSPSVELAAGSANATSGISSAPVGSAASTATRLALAGAALTASRGETAIIRCIGEKRTPFKVVPAALDIVFMPAAIALPTNTASISMDKIEATLFVPETQYVWYLDLLRNEGPICATVNSLTPELNCLYTLDERVGEGE